jgi:RNA polymerase-binding transcription factor DksA
MATKKKTAKPAVKKPVRSKGGATKSVKSGSKKPALVKKAAKPAPKKTVKPAPKKAVKPVAKAKKIVSKPVAKKVSPAKKTAHTAGRPKNKIIKPAVKKPAVLKKPVQKPMTKKIEVKKPTPVKAAPAPPVKSSALLKAKDIKVAAPKPVVLPKINTKTSRKYQPDFTKSVLDQLKNDPGAPLVRYNDTDLNEFRELIQRKMESAKKELTYLQGLITRKDEMGGDNDDARYMTMEDGSMSMEREQLSQMASRQITFIDHLEKAIMRIENKTYGICRVTGKLIDKARLRAVPHATLSIEAKMGAVR